MSAGKTMLERKEAQAALRAGKVVEKIAGLMEARAKGEDIRLEELFALVDGCRDELSVEEIARWKREVGEDWDRIEAPPVEAKPIQRWHNGRRLLLVKPPPQAPKTTETNKEPPKTEAAPRVLGDIKFHKSDLKPEVKLPTIKEKEEALEKLADLREGDPLAYAEGRKEWANRLCTTVAAIDQAVKIVLDKRADDGDQSQATKLVAIGMGDNIRRWHSPNSEGSASIQVG